MEDVGDFSDENEPFDLDLPAHLRTFLSPNSFRTLEEERLARAAAEEEAEKELLNTSFTSMISHQAAEAVIESCLSSMLAHRVSGPSLEPDVEEQLPQCDGMEDFDSEEEFEAGEAGAGPEVVPAVAVEEVATSNDNVEAVEVVEAVEAVEAVEGEEIYSDSAELSGAGIEEFSLPETTEQHQIYSSGEVAEVEAVALAEVGEPAEVEVEDPQETYQEICNTEESLYPMEVGVMEGNMEDEESSGLHQILNGEVEETEENYQVNEDEDEVQGNYAGDFPEDEEFESDYDVEEEEEDFNSPEPPAKRSRPSSEAEVVLDSDDNDEVTPQPPPLAAQARPPMFPYQAMTGGSLQQQQYMMMAQQRARQQQQQQAAAYYNLQHQLQQQHQVAGLGRKRAREGLALCIKDSEVYIKPFSQLPSFLVNNNSKPEPPQVPQVPSVQQSYMALFGQQPLQPLQPLQQQTNPYKPPVQAQPQSLPSLSQNPYQPLPARSFPAAAYQSTSHSGRDSVEDLEDSDQDILDEASRSEDFNSDDDDIQSVSDSVEDVKDDHQDQNKPVLDEEKVEVSSPLNNEDAQTTDDTTKDSVDSQDDIEEQPAGGDALVSGDDSDLAMNHLISLNHI